MIKAIQCMIEAIQCMIEEIQCMIEAIQCMIEAIQCMIEAIQCMIEAIQCMIEAIQCMIEAIQCMIEAIQYEGKAGLSVVNESTVLVTWRKPTKQNVVKVKLEIKTLHGYQRVRINKYNEAYSALIDKLDKNSTYRVSLSYDESPRSFMQEEFSLYIPTPKNLHILYVLDNSIKVAWEEIIDTKWMLSYTVKCWSLNFPQVISVTSATKSAVIEGLQPSTEYEINVRAHTYGNEVASEYSVKIRVRTLPREVQNDAAVHLCPEGDIFGYACPSSLREGHEVICIPKTWLCDEDPDCPLGEDELSGFDDPCHMLLDCDKDQFQCTDATKLCIPKNWMCDGDLDCEDGSDENKTNCLKTGVNRTGPHMQNLIPCTPNELQCSGTHSCIPLTKVCDTTFDCDSGEDEFGCFNENCQELNCSKCAKLATEGAKCYCDEGLVWDPDTSNCTDLNECDYERFCDQPSQCTNSPGGYTCGCVSGYNLTGTKYCKALNEPDDNVEGRILISNHWDQRQFTLNGEMIDNELQVGDKLTALDFDHGKKTMYWISYNENRNGKSTLYSRSVGASNKTVDTIKINKYLTYVESFAKDWITGNWYFADPQLLSVSVCSADGKYCNNIITRDKNSTLLGPNSITLDPIEGYVYIADYDEGTGSILRCKMNGDDLQVFVGTKIEMPMGLTIDYANRHLYWADKELNVVERIDLSGDSSSRRIIRIGQIVDYVHSMSVFENYIYLSDRSENQIVKIHRYNYTEPAVSLATLVRPGQIHIYHRQRQPSLNAENPCNTSDCEHICTIENNDGVLNAKCMCSAGFDLVNGKCQANTICSEFCPDIDDNNNVCTGPTVKTYPSTCSLALCPPDLSYCTGAAICLPSTWWCDHSVDCMSGDDEDFSCRYKDCDVTEFECASGRCISITDKCNGVNNCYPYDNSDEEGCPNITCTAENNFQCTEPGGDCIFKEFVCDGHRDCEHGSDEDPSICDFKPINKCNEDIEFQCRSGECIALSWECDSDPDCQDGSDEDVEHCETKTHCQDLERPCDSGDRCIPEKWFCDSEPDCLDRSDESDKNCPDANYTCPYPRKKCEKDGIHVCLRLEQLCDGNNDCDDEHFDEGGLCKSMLCSNASCNRMCYNAPEAPGFICDCPQEEKLDTDGSTCISAVAVNKLCEQWGICSQKCELDNTLPRGYKCSCFNGFFLEPDEFTCKPLESNPVYVVYSNRHELRRVDVAASNAISLRSGLRNTIALDFYYSNGEPVLFWTDVMEDKIYRGTMSGNSIINEEAIIKTGLATTEGVTVDWVAENIYWVESSLDQIEVASVDGTKRTTLVAGNMTSPRAIVVDPREGSLFWTDWDGHNPRIEKSSMCGDGRSIIHQIRPAEGGGWPNGLAIDYDFKRLYWVDARSESIHSIDYFGNDHRLILRNHKDMTHPFAMSLFGIHVYWTDWDTNCIVRANKFNGSNVEIVQKAITQPFDLQVIHPKRQPYMVNPCAENNGGCSDLCLLSYNNTIGCRCPHRKKLDKDGKTCIDDIKFLLFTRSQEIRGVDLVKAHFNVIPVITIPYVDQPTAIDYDVTSNTLYWADKGLNVINKANITADAEVETLIDKGLSNVEGFAIDWMSGNMYFSSYDLNAKTASISVATLNGTFRTELLNKDIVRPKSIALHPLKGLMYFTDVSGIGGTHKLFFAKMDGDEFKPLMENLDEPSSLSVDIDDNRLYFINAGNKSIMSCDLDGRDVNIIQSSNITNPQALTVYKDKLYVSTEDKIVTVNKDGSGYTKLRDSTTNVNALLLFDMSIRRREPTNDCHRRPSKCSQLCLPSASQLSMCKCTAGFDIGGDDNTSCIGIRSFLLYARETEIRGQKFAPMSTQEALPPISQIQSASAIDFLASEDTIFWVDTKANTISRIKRDLTKREVIIRDGLNSVEGLAVDWIAKHIYWTDAGHSTIEMSKINGTNRYVITSGDMEKPRSIVVNPVLGYLYWSDWGTESRIERVRLDGSERVQYIYNDINLPWGLTIDYETHNLYWCDTAAEQQTIEAIDLLTDKRRILVKQSVYFPMNPISLTVFNDSIYWIDGNLNETSMYRASKADGSAKTLIRNDLGGSLKDVKAFDASRQTGTNKCAVNNGGCAELCFYIGNNVVKCACSFGKLAEDGKTCEEYDGFLLFSKVTELVSIHLKDANDKNPPVESIKSATQLRNVIGLSFDYARKLIYYSDIQRGDIQAVDFKGQLYRKVVDGIGSAEGLAYEKINDDLYWTSYTNSCISRINVNEALNNVSLKAEVVIQLSKHDHPRAIVVDSCWELVYWTNWNSEKPRIQRSDLNGKNAEDVIVKDILTPNGLTIDHKAKKLYWSDARLDKIERCDMDGSNRHVIITSIPQHSFGLVIYDDYLFWTDWMLRAVIRANKYDGTEIIWLRKSLERQPMGIIAVANDSENCEINKCHENNFGCQDKCYTNEKGEAFCQCNHGRLKADGKSCASDKNKIVVHPHI
ncbi:Exosome complex protein [Mactra antiquata]